MGKKGWIVTLAGMGLNLTLGILYAWSMFSKQLTESIENNGFGWSKMTATLPYTIAIAVFAVVMVPAGRLRTGSGPVSLPPREHFWPGRGSLSQVSRPRIISSLPYSDSAY